jgi:hypothetical protein
MWNFFRRSTDNKQRVNKERNVDIDSPTSSVGQGKHMKCINVSWPPLVAALSILTFDFFVENVFVEKLTKTKEISINA